MVDNKLFRDLFYPKELEDDVENIKSILTFFERFDDEFLFEFGKTLILPEHYPKITKNNLLAIKDFLIRRKKDLETKST